LCLEFISLSATVTVAIYAVIDLLIVILVLCLLYMICTASGAASFFFFFVVDRILFCPTTQHADTKP
jgi:hypothetical protein